MNGQKFLELIKIVDDLFPKTTKEDSFHQYFLDNIYNKDYAGSHDENKITRDQFFSDMKSGHIYVDPSVINNYTAQIASYHIKPYYLLYDCPDFYIAKESFGGVWFINFRNLMMVDCDIGPTNDISQEQIDCDIQEYIEVLQDYCDRPDNKDQLFVLYRTNRGLHNFLVSHKKDFNSIDTFETMLRLQGDKFHAAFSYLRGWCVRLNKKEKETDDQLYRLIGFVGNGQPDPDLLAQVQFHIDIIPLFQDDVCDLTTRFILENKKK